MTGPPPGPWGMEEEEDDDEEESSSSSLGTV